MADFMVVGRPFFTLPLSEFFMMILCPDVQFLGPICCLHSSVSAGIALFPGLMRPMFDLLFVAMAVSGRFVACILQFLQALPCFLD